MRSNIVFILTIIFLVPLFQLGSSTSAFALPVGPPTNLDASLVSISEPHGSTISISVPKTAASNVDTDSIVTIINATSGVAKSSAWSSGMVIKLIASANDSLTWKIDNPGQGSVQENLAYVPVSSIDSAKPDIEVSLLSTTFDAVTGNFSITGNPGSILDTSEPFEAKMRVQGSAVWGQTVFVSGNGTKSTSSFSLQAPANSGDIIILRVTDDYGNWQEILWEADKNTAQTTSALFPTQYGSPNQYNAQMIGNPTIAGDGILLPAREFTTGVTLFSNKGISMSTSLSLSYLSSNTYDGGYGKGFDSILDMRVKNSISPTSTSRYILNEGVEIGPFTYNASRSSSLLEVYSPPAGVFYELVFDLKNNVYYSNSQTTNRWVFDSKTGLISEIQSQYYYNPKNVNPPEYGAKLVFIRNHLNQVTQIKSDNPNKVVDLSWYGHGRLAMVRDTGFYNTETVLRYDAAGRLTGWVAPGQSVSLTGDRYGYEGTTTKIESVYNIFGDKVLDNTYIADQVTEQRDWYNRDWASPVTVHAPLEVETVVSSQSGVALATQITMPNGGISVVGFNNAPDCLPVMEKSYSNLDFRSQPAFPGDDDEDWVQKNISYSNINLQPDAKWYSTATQPSATLEKEEWIFAYTNATDDPWLKPFIAEHRYLGDAAQQTPTMIEKWQYKTGKLEFYTEIGGGVVNYNYNEYGELLEEYRENVVNGGETYTLKSSWTYDFLGRIVSTNNIDRNYQIEQAPGQQGSSSVGFEYYDDSNITPFQFGYIKRISNSSLDGTEIRDSTFEYDSAGAIVLEIDSLGNTVESEYDSYGRQIATKESIDENGNKPEIRLFYEGTGQIGSRIKEVYQKARNIDGSAIHTGWIKTSSEFDPMGGVLTSERDFDLNGPAGSELRRSKTTYSYNELGFVSEELRWRNANSAAKTSYEYDSRKMLLVKREYAHFSDETAVPSIDEYHRYDFAGRPKEFIGESKQEYHYDLYGRSNKTVTKSVRMNLSVIEDSAFGNVEEEIKYDDKNRPYLQTQSFILTTPSVPQPQLLGAGRIVYDDASRVIATGTPRDTYNDLESDLSWHYTNYKHTPGGAIKEVQVGNSLSTIHRNDFNEIIKFVDPDSNERHTEYDPLGRISLKIYKPFDQTTNTLAVGYHTSFRYDANGLLVEKKELGEPGSNEVRGKLLAYDSRGRLRSQKYYLEYLDASRPLEFAEESTYDSNFANLVVLNQTGDIAAGDYRQKVSTYDLLGNQLSISTSDSIFGGGKTTSSTYDALGRKKTVTLPRRSITANPRTISYDYKPGSYSVEKYTDVLGIEKVFTFNSLGYLLTIGINKSLANPHIQGPDRVEFSYIDRDDNDKVAGSPIVSRTFSKYAGSSVYEVETEIKRTYNIRGQITLDSIILDEQDDPIDTVMEYDSLGRRLEIIHTPGQADSTKQLYTPGGKIKSILSKNDNSSSYMELMRYEYRGDVEKKAVSLDTTGAVVMATETKQDASGYIEDVVGREGELNTSPLLRTLRYRNRDALGRMRALDENKDSTYDLLEWDKQGRIKSISRGSTDPIVLNSAGTNLQGFEWASPTELKKTTRQLNSDPEVTTAEYELDDAGFSNAAVTPNINSHVMEVSNEDATAEMTNRFVDMDEAGNVISDTFNIDVQYGNSSEWTVEEVTTTYTYDAWGRKVSSFREQGTIAANRNLNPPISLEYSSIADNAGKRDAFGRLVLEDVYADDSDHYASGRLVNSYLGDTAFHETFQTPNGTGPYDALSRITSISRGGGLSKQIVETDLTPGWAPDPANRNLDVNHTAYTRTQWIGQLTGARIAASEGIAGVGFFPRAEDIDRSDCGDHNPGNGCTVGISRHTHWVEPHAFSHETTTFLPEAGCPELPNPLAQKIGPDYNLVIPLWTVNGAVDHCAPPAPQPEKRYSSEVKEDLESLEELSEKKVKDILKKHLNKRTKKRIGDDGIDIIVEQIMAADNISDQVFLLGSVITLDKAYPTKRNKMGGIEVLDNFLRSGNKLMVTSSKTNYDWTSRPWLPDTTYNLKVSKEISLAESADAIFGKTVNLLSNRQTAAGALFLAEFSEKGRSTEDAITYFEGLKSLASQYSKQLAVVGEVILDLASSLNPGATAAMTLNDIAVAYDSGDLLVGGATLLGGKMLGSMFKKLATRTAKTFCFIGDTEIATSNGLVKVEELAVGQRVLTSSVDQRHQSGREIKPASWRKIKLQIKYSDSNESLLDIVVLRPVEWVEDQDIVAGDNVLLKLEALGIKGFAKVLEIAPCPKIENVAGSIVTATVNHVTNSVIRLHFAGKDEPLELTGGHLLSSISHDDWVPAEELQVGDWVRTSFGQLQVSFIASKPGSHRVYNLEVDTDHCYFVSDHAILCHNAPCDLSGELFSNGLNKGTARGRLQRALKSKKPYAAHHLIPIEIDDHELVQLAARGGFNFNGKMNGMKLLAEGPRKKHSGGHPGYTTYVGDKLDDLLDRRPNMTPGEASVALQGLTRSLRKKIGRRRNGVIDW